MNRRRLLAAGSVMVFLAIASPAFAIFGFGDIVFDPSVYAEAIEQVLQLERQYAQLLQTYQMIRSEYEHLKWMAKRVPVDMVTRYKAAATPWQNSSAANTYGTTEAWTAGITTGLGASSGYAGAVERLHAYGEALSNVPGDQQARIKADYATVELTDGANIAAIETIGRLRANAHGVETAIQGLEADSLSADPDMNTEIAVLNKINAANLISTRSEQDANKLLVALTEAQIIDAKRKRDAEAAAINNDIRFRTEGRTVMHEQVADASAAIRSWRLP